MTRNSVHLPPFLVGKFSIGHLIRHIKAVNKQSQETTAEPKFFLTSSQVPQFPQRGDLEEH